MTTNVPGLAFTRETRVGRWRTTCWRATFEDQPIGTWGAHSHRWVADGSITTYLRDWRAACVAEARRRIRGPAVTTRIIVTLSPDGYTAEPFIRFGHRKGRETCPSRAQFKTRGAHA